MHNLEFNILDQFNYPILIIDQNSNILWANKKLRALYKLEELTLLYSSNSFYDNNILRLKDIFYEIKLSKTSEGNSIISFFNITKRKALEEKILNKQKTFESLSENLPLGIVLFSERISYTNPTFEKLVGFNGTELKNKYFEELFENNNKIIFNTNIDKLINLQRKSIDFKVQITNKNKQLIWVTLTTRIIKVENSNTFISVIRDITSEINRIKELERLANYDKLTKIYNRRKFEELLDIEYKIIHRYKRDLSAIFFDIDHFKNINDTYGHDVGDYVLKTLSEIVRRNIRETDIFARWGGEEFIILLIETSKEEANEIAEKIRKIIMNYNFAQVASVTISLGISQFKEEERKNTFLKRLDTALYHSKNNGRNTSTIL